ncbi:MAG: HAMP domain-containing protein [Deltaproteobacteria bacterium]|nr:HAMP domain-containing protein [Deltaproteobacteria bacterium]
MRKKRRLIRQLYPSYLVVILLSLLAISWYTSRTLKQSYLDRTKSDLQAQGQLLANQVLGLLSPFDPMKVDRLCKKVGKNTATRFTVIMPDGTVIGDSNETPRHMDNHGNRPEIAAAYGGKVGASTRYSNTFQQSMMYVALPLTTEGRLLSVVRTSIALTAIEAAIWSWQLKIILAGFLIALLASGVCLYISRRISRPIETMTQGAERFARGDLKHRLKQSETLELARLAKALNQMAAELENRIENLLNQRNEYEAVLSSMLEGVIAVDMDERILSINQAAVKMLEIASLDLKGRNILEAIRNRSIHEFVVDALNSGVEKEGDVVIHQQGELILNTQCIPLRNAADDRIGTLVVLNDVTKMRHLENVRRDFVANVSHEIKTPLTAIKGFVETLLDGSAENPEDLSKFLEIM